jgi:ferritin-like metal-binding protein YciE
LPILALVLRTPRSGGTAGGVAVAAAMARTLLSNRLSARPQARRFHGERFMPDIKTLHEVFLDEMRDMYNAEQQITKALPRLIKVAEADELRRALEFHLGETETQIERLERAFALLNEKPRGKKCDGMEGILEEGRKVLEDGLEGAVRDAAIIAGAQRVEHYETAAYGTLVAWAELMQHDEVARLLRESLEEEKNADRALSNLAETGINADALRRSDHEVEPAMAAAGNGRTKPNGRGRSLGAARTRSRSR